MRRGASRRILKSSRLPSHKPKSLRLVFEPRQLVFGERLLDESTYRYFVLSGADPHSAEIYLTGLRAELINHATLSQVHNVVLAARKRRDGLGVHLDAPERGPPRKCLGHW